MMTLARRWQGQFWEAIRQRDTAGALREASLRAEMRAWTEALTAAVVEACRAMGWAATAKGHRLELLPVARSEYLSLDVVAFPDGAGGWRLPVAVMELENSSQEKRIAYSLWKLLCVRADLRVLFCYRRNAEAGAPLVRWLRDRLVAGMTQRQRIGLDGQTLVVVGSRGEAETFPYGFFKWWQLDASIGQFVLL